MTLYATRNAHKLGNRTHVNGPLRPAEKQRHPSDSAWVRPDGEPSLLAGTAYFLGLIAIMVAAFWSIAG